LSYNYQSLCICVLKVKVHDTGHETLTGKGYTFSTPGVRMEDLRILLCVSILKAIPLKARGIVTQVDNLCVLDFRTSGYEDWPLENKPSFHCLCSLSCGRSITSSKESSPHSATYSFLFQTAVPLTSSTS
jgi:hypothetical protein